MGAASSVRLKRVGLGWAVFLLAAGMMAAGALARWQVVNERATSCLSNERKLATALLLYSQDYDSCFPRPEFRSTGTWFNWIMALGPYADAASSWGTCPANPSRGARSASTAAPYPYSYALNNRFYGVFAPGPFPLDNLEIPAQTVLIAEAGSCGGLRLREPAYTDTSRGACIYPSPHEGRMNVAAADGHVASIIIRHYRPLGHNPLYGRMGGSIYNWNGGHPNGRTWEPPLE